MNEIYTSYLAHHGILGQKWGVRRTLEQLGHKTKQSKGSKVSKSQRRKKAMQTGQRILKTAGGASILLTSFYSLVNSRDGRYNIALGKQFVNSYLKVNGSKKVSDIKSKDYTWADYAWDEINRG